MSKPVYCKLSRRFVLHNMVSTYCACINCTKPKCDEACEHNMKTDLPDIQTKKCNACLAISARGTRKR